MDRITSSRRLPFVMAGMEACWLYTVLLLLQEKTGSKGFVWVLSMYFLSWLFHRILLHRPWSWPRRGVASASGWILVTLLLSRLLASHTTEAPELSWLRQFGSGLTDFSSFPTPEQLFLVSGALLWWLGRRLAGLQQVFSTLISEFQFGLSLLLILFFMEARWGLHLPGLVFVCLAFFAFSFVGISLAHGKEGKGWVHSAERSRWLVILLFTISIAFALGFVISAVVKPDFLKLLFSIPKLLWQGVSELLLMIITFLINLFPEPEPLLMQTPGGGSAIPSEPPSWVKIFILPAWFRRVAQVVVGSLWLALILAALWSLSSQIFRWLRQKMNPNEGATIEPISGAFREDLLHLLRSLLEWIARIFPFLFRRKGERSVPVPEEAASVRRIYRQLLEKAGAAGCPRHTAQTPAEYLQALVDWRPEARREFSFITLEYVSVRYGRSLPEKENLEQTLEAWNRLRALIKGKQPARHSASGYG